MTSQAPDQHHREDIPSLKCSDKRLWPDSHWLRFGSIPISGFGIGSQKKRSYVQWSKLANVHSKDGRTGRRKIIEMWCVHIPTFYNEYTHYVLQTCTDKTLLMREGFLPWVNDDGWTQNNQHRVNEMHCRVWLTYISNQKGKTLYYAGSYWGCTWEQSESSGIVGGNFIVTRGILAEKSGWSSGTRTNCVLFLLNNKCRPGRNPYS